MDEHFDATVAGGPTIRVLAQFVREMRFDNPLAPESLRAGLPSPSIDLGIDVNARAAADLDSAFEVDLRLTAQAMRGDKLVFHADLIYAGLFALDYVSAAKIEPTLLIECPRLLFPFARRVLADAIREGGFPPLLVDPVDFASLYANQTNGVSEGVD